MSANHFREMPCFAHDEFVNFFSRALWGAAPPNEQIQSFGPLHDSAAPSGVPLHLPEKTSKNGNFEDSKTLRVTGFPWFFYDSGHGLKPMLVGGVGMMWNHGKRSGLLVQVAYRTGGTSSTTPPRSFTWFCDHGKWAVKEKPSPYIICHFGDVIQSLSRDN